MQRSSIFVLSLATSLLLLPVSAKASPITIDFTNGARYGGIGGTSTLPILDQGLAVSLSSTGGNLTHASDGIGINGPGGDDGGEVGYYLGNQETLTISFPSTTLYSFDLRQFFSNDNLIITTYIERGQYQINGVGGWNNFNANSTTGLFHFDFAGGLGGVTSIGFRTPGAGLTRSLDDYSVAQMSVENPVPEPASMLLLGTGLAIGAARRYRARTRATRS